MLSHPRHTSSRNFVGSKHLQICIILLRGTHDQVRASLSTTSKPAKVFCTPALYPSSRPGLPIKAYLTGSLASLWFLIYVVLACIHRLNAALLQCTRSFFCLVLDDLSFVLRHSRSCWLFLGHGIGRLWLFHQKLPRVRTHKCQYTTAYRRPYRAAHSSGRSVGEAEKVAKWSEPVARWKIKHGCPLKVPVQCKWHGTV